MGIVRFALRLPHTFYVLAALVLFLGGTAVLSMPTDIFPEINIPVVTIIWQYTGLSTPEMEQRVTTYGQYALSSSVNGIRDIEAQTINGISVQKVFFQPDVNLDLAIAQIVSATNFIRILMPPGIQAPVVVQYNASSVPVLQIGLSSETLNEQQLYDYGWSCRLGGGASSSTTLQRRSDRAGLVEARVAYSPASEGSGESLIKRAVPKSPPGFAIRFAMPDVRANHGEARARGPRGYYRRARSRRREGAPGV